MSIVIPSLHPDKIATDLKKMIRYYPDQESFSIYMSDESRCPGGNADEIVLPNTELQISKCLKIANCAGTPVTVSGGRTGIVAGAVPYGGILLSVEKMNRFLGARWDEIRNAWIVRVQPGLTLENLKCIIDTRKPDTFIDFNQCQDRDTQKFLEESNHWCYPVNPTEQTAQIGGTVATDASGARSYKYGSTRNHIVSLHFVLMDGTVLDIPRGKYVGIKCEDFHIESKNEKHIIPCPTYFRAQTKNTAGYFSQQPLDFIDLLIGSEGTLGVITEIELILSRKPEMILGSLAFFQTEEQAVHFVNLIKTNHNRDLDPSALEFFDKNSLQLLREKSKSEGSSFIPTFPGNANSAIYFEQDCDAESLESYCIQYSELISEAGARAEDSWGGIDENEMKKMAAFRHAVPEEINNRIRYQQMNCPRIHKISTDISVPDDALNTIMQIYKKKLLKENLDFVIFGHIGDNHLHVNMIPKDIEEFRHAKELALHFAKEGISLGGSVSAEHGIGKLKKEIFNLMYPSSAIDQMQRIKIGFDPKGLLGQKTLFE